MSKSLFLLVSNHHYSCHAPSSNKNFYYFKPFNSSGCGVYKFSGRVNVIVFASPPQQEHHTDQPSTAARLDREENWQNMRSLKNDFLHNNQGRWPSFYSEDSHERKLAEWIAKQRYLRPTISSKYPDRHQDLKQDVADGLWSWHGEGRSSPPTPTSHQRLDWWEMADKAATFVRKHNGRWPQTKSSVPDERQLAYWIYRQRKRGPDVLGAEDVDKFEALDGQDWWSWEYRPIDAQWHTTLDELEDFIIRNNGRWPSLNPKVHRRAAAGGSGGGGEGEDYNKVEKCDAEKARVQLEISLARWVTRQRNQSRWEVMAEKNPDQAITRREELEAKSWWTWDNEDARRDEEEAWQAGFDGVGEFYKVHGYLPRQLRPSKRSYKSRSSSSSALNDTTAIANERELYDWVKKQRREKTLLQQQCSERYKQLSTAQWWRWSVWEANFSAVEMFVKQHNRLPRAANRLVPRPEARLGTWVALQRQKRAELREHAPEKYAALSNVSWWKWSAGGDNCGN